MATHSSVLAWRIPRMEEPGGLPSMGLIIIFLPRRKRLLILWLQPSSAVILESRKIKSVTVSIVSPSICHGDGTKCHDLHFLNVEF